MSPESSAQLPRKPRRDAVRNRDRILKVARQIFTESGPDASLDEIAKRAGVGAGTLYRHFPTRYALLEDVYRAGVEELAAAEQRFGASMSPIEALRAWLLLFVDYMAAKQIIAPALNADCENSPKVFESSGTLITGAINSLVKRAVANGDIRPDMEPLDLLRALVGISNVIATPDWPKSAKQMVDILILGSRPVKS